MCNPTNNLRQRILHKLFHYIWDIYTKFDVSGFLIEYGIEPVD